MKENPILYSNRQPRDYKSEATVICDSLFDNFKMKIILVWCVDDEL